MHIEIDEVKESYNSYLKKGYEENDALSLSVRDYGIAISKSLNNLRKELSLEQIKIEPINYNVLLKSDTDPLPEEMVIQDLTEDFDNNNINENFFFKAKSFLERVGILRKKRTIEIKDNEIAKSFNPDKNSPLYVIKKAFDVGIVTEEEYIDTVEYLTFTEPIEKAEYQGREVELNKPMRGENKKYKVYVKNENGNIVKVEFGDPNMDVRRDNPEARKNFRARHNCADKKDKTTAGYWSCKMWSTQKVSDILNKAKAYESFAIIEKAFNEGLIEEDQYFKSKELFEKAQGHKYIKREGTKGNYKYIYTDEKEQSNQEVDIERLSPEEEQGRLRGGSTNVEATKILRGNEITNSTEPERVGELITKQEDLLTQYAKENGKWFEYDKVSSKEPFGGGEEAKVFMNEDGVSVTKVYDYQLFSISLLEFIDNRISLHNHLFPDTAYELLGFTNRPNRGFSFVVKQPFIDSAKNTSTQDISKEMKKMGFKDIGGNTYVSENYIIDDLHKRNVLTGEDGKLYFIDTVISLNEEGEGYGGKRKYNQIKKSFLVIKQGYEEGSLDKSQYEKAKDLFEKARAGVYADNSQNRRLNRVGQKFGSKKQEKQTADKPKASNEVSGGKKQYSDTELQEHAKNASEADLKRHISEGTDPRLRAAAHKELYRRSKEEKVQEEGGKDVSNNKEQVSFSDLKIENNFNKNIQSFKPLEKEMKKFKVLKNVSLEDMSNLIGDSPFESSVKLSVDSFGDDNSGGLMIQVESDGIVYGRTVDIKAGSIVKEMDNEFLDISKDKQGNGIGTKIFANQIKAAQKLGIQLNCIAAKSNSKNGYYTWARLGYDFARDVEKDIFLGLVSSSQNDKIKTAKSLPELMTFPEGQKFWKENGFQFRAKFDTKDGSDSMIVFTEYYKNKFNS